MVAKDTNHGNFQQLMVQNPALQWLWNSVFISLATMLLVCMTSSLAGYVLAKKRFYGQRILFATFIAAMALPKQVVLVPLVRIINFMGIHDTLAAVILPLVGWPFGVFLMKQFSENIPTELLESAKIDGCGELRTFWSVASQLSSRDLQPLPSLPLSTPGTTTLCNW